MNFNELKTTGKRLFIIRSYEMLDEYEAQIAIDFDFPGVKEKIKEMSLFWGGHPPEEAAFEEHLDFVLRLIAAETYYIKVGKGYNDYGVRKEFTDKKGFYPLDGSNGIFLEETSFPEIYMDEFIVGVQQEYTGDFDIKKGSEK